MRPTIDVIRELPPKNENRRTTKHTKYTKEHKQAKEAEIDPFRVFRVFRGSLSSLWNHLYQSSVAPGHGSIPSGRQPLEIGGRASLQPRRGDGEQATSAPLGLIKMRCCPRPRGFRPLAINQRPSGAGHQNRPVSSLQSPCRASFFCNGGRIPVTCVAGAASIGPGPGYRTSGEVQADRCMTGRPSIASGCC